MGFHKIFRNVESLYFAIDTEQSISCWLASPFNEFDNPFTIDLECIVDLILWLMPRQA